MLKGNYPVRFKHDIIGLLLKMLEERAFKVPVKLGVGEADYKGY